jgi:hypothetical protein
MVDMIHHPSGRVCSEQTNTWIILLRDPQISKSTMLSPFVDELINTYLDHLVRLRWVDVEEGTHPNAGILEASYDDEVSEGHATLAELLCCHTFCDTNTRLLVAAE